MAHNFSFNDTDKRIAADIQSRLPDRLFDIHGHLYIYEHMKSPSDEWMSPGPAVSDVAAYREHIGRQVGLDRLENALFFAMPSLKLDIGPANEFLIDQVARTPGSRGLLLVGPNTSREQAEKWLSSERIVGFKPYSFFSTEEEKYACAPGTFIPDWVWEVANQRGLLITLHVVKEGAIADPENYGYVIDKCSKYPSAKLILAHCGRTFNANNARRGLPKLRGLKNVWFDTAAVCEPGPFISVIREFGVEKLIWGTDFPDSEIRGRCVTVGDGFFWVQPDTVSAEPGYGGFYPTLVGLESTRALLEAADYLNLSKPELNRIFHDNAIELLESAR